MKKLTFILFVTLVAAVSCSKDNPTPTPTPTSPDMVDLGLSVKWASFNVGATKPEEFGTYFAWGDVTGQTWDGTKWSGGGFSTAPKYEVDANGNLKPEYDAAHVKFGGDWRMPTKEECQALIDNCTATWVKSYNGTGVSGCMFTSKINGNSIFMPAAGGGGRSDLTGTGSGGYYWSSTFYYDNIAWRLGFTSDNVGTGNGTRSYGRSIRAVADKSVPDPSVVIDLSAPGTANCYNVPFAGNFKFKATVKGNSTESVGTPASAEVLWESFGTSVAPSKGAIVNNVSLENGYVKFSTPTALANGNAVIAIKDASGNILWSWHIWACKDFYPSASAQVYNNNAGTLMDRNLGATSATPGDVHALGLLYQWGRKDPFLGSSSISSATVAESTTTWPSAVSSDANQGTIAYSIAHPTSYITRNINNDDWYYSSSSTTDNTRWQSTKTIYDPCPHGWRIPDGGTNGVWSKAFGQTESWTTPSNWDATNKGMDFGKTDKTLGSGAIWYPVTGCRGGGDGLLCYVGVYGRYHSCVTIANNAHILRFGEDANVNPVYGSDRADGRSVRCIKEK